MKTTTKSLLTIPLAILVASCFIATSASAALVLNDPGFEGALTDVGTDFTQADSADFDKWVYWDTDREWTTVATGGNPGGYASAVYGANFVKRTLYQAVTDDKATTGLVDLTFDLNLLNLDQSSNGALLAAVWGIETISGANFSLTTSNQTPATSGDAVLLGSQSFSTNTSGWETQTVSGIDFGTGYDVIIVGFKSALFQTTNGDFLGIDNVSVIPEPSSIALLGLAGLAAMAFCRRRK